MPHMSGIGRLQNELIRRRCDLPIVFSVCSWRYRNGKLKPFIRELKRFLVKPPRLDKLLEYIKKL